MRWLLFFLCLVPMSAAAVPQVQELDTDIPVWLIEDYTVPVVSVSMTFDGAGSAYEPAAKQGLARLVASLLQEGADGMSAAAFQSYLNRHALQLSAGAGRDNFSVGFYGLREHANEGFRAMTKMLTQPNLEQAALDRVRAQHLSALALMQQDPSYFAGRTLAETLYKNHPYARHAQGTKETLAAITLEDARAYLLDAIQQKRLRIVAAGAIRAEELERLVETMLDAIPEGDGEWVPVAAVPPIESVMSADYATDNPQSEIRFAMPGVKRDDPDFFAAYVLAHILGGNGLTSILAEEIRQERGLTYGIYSWLENPDATALLAGGFATATATRDEAIAALNETLDRVHQEGVSAELHAQAIAYITGAFPLALDSSRGLSNYLQSMQRNDLGTDYLNQRNQYFEAVTLEDVNRVAKKLLDPQKRVIVWAGQENENE